MIFSLIGVELDEKNASRAAQRMEHSENAVTIDIIILDCTDLNYDGTVFLFCPFNGNLLLYHVLICPKAGDPTGFENSV